MHVPNLPPPSVASGEPLQTTNIVLDQWVTVFGSRKLGLGRLLAHDGAWEDRQIIPVQWMIDATTVRASDAYLAPGRASPRAFGYG